MQRQFLKTVLRERHAPAEPRHLDRLVGNSDHIIDPLEPPLPPRIRCCISDSTNKISRRGTGDLDHKRPKYGRKAKRSKNDQYGIR